ncbi:hypothetical protein FO519_003754 [Halicephalobus sp. NKZ332]|nr:hypothetical protein FO519_003754 [Halicephalobus sp. NKZ332]
MPYGIEIGGFSKQKKEGEEEVRVVNFNEGPLPEGKLRENTIEERKGSGRRPFNISLPNSTSHIAKLPRRGSIPISINNYTKRLEELNENESEKLYDEFELLEKSKPPHATAFSTAQSSRRNRFYDIVPFEYNRVILKYGEGSDYINASFINNTEGERSYIAAQGPMGENECVGGRRDSTISDFWRLVWQEDIDCIVMLTQLVEGLRSKCSPYWPENAGDTMQLDNGLSIMFYCIVEDENSFQREFLLYDSYSDTPKKVLQWHFKKWRDGTAPENKTALLHFIKQVRASPHSSPILVHCSAGVGRTGVFIAIDQLLDNLENREDLDIFGVVNSLREQRQNMVQNIDQYATIYDVIALAVRQKLGQEKDRDELTSLDRNKWLSDDSSIQ